MVRRDDVHHRLAGSSITG